MAIARNNQTNRASSASRRTSTDSPPGGTRENFSKTIKQSNADPTPPATDPLADFHPVIQAWFRRRFEAPTDAQAAGWPAIRSGGDVLIAAPTGSGKTLAAFLAGIDALIRQPDLPDTTSIVYVSPLKALGNDIQRNLEAPLAELQEVADEMGVTLPTIRVSVRTGDTPQADRQAMVRKPPHILITTPESFYLMLTAARSRERMRDVRTVIVDEIHALARDKRGSHFSLSMTRLDYLNEARPQRVGLSATQRPTEDLAAFLVGSEPGPAAREGNVPNPCTIVDLGHQRDLELHVDVPPSDLEAVAPKEQWDDVYNRLAELILAHRTTLIFVNTRRLSERVAHNLSQRLGEDLVASHHGSLSRDRRLRVEERLKSGQLRALVATASLELGIDIGSIDLVCQIGSPRSIATFLQRVGRSGHALGLRPHGRLFPTTRDELIECAALIRAARAGYLDRIVQPVAPLDVLAQQIVAETSCEDWREDELFDLFRRATPYRDLDREEFDDIVQILAHGVGEGAGGSPPLIHRDRINRIVRGRRGSRMTAILNGGTIPELGDFRVIADPDETVVGTVNEDWAIESMAGDIFLLGSTSWKIRRIESAASVVRVEDAHGQPPTIPFWLGEAPGRTIELSEEVGRLRVDVETGLGDPDAVREKLKAECGLDDLGAIQIIDYVRASRDALGLIPSHRDVVFERFFDESGGMQLVVHAPFGARINKAWGLTLRKRFCVNFDFELQAAASDDAIVLSLGPQHSFPLEESFAFVTSRNAAEALRQSILYVPLFPTRWRWNSTRALAVRRQTATRKVPPQIQRMRSDDLLAAVFPEQVGCQENLTGPLQIPDHPLVRQTVADCLYEAMDLDGLLALLAKIEAGEVRLHARDTVEPSPMAHEILAGKPFTYLDDAPLEERRTRAVALRRTLPESARDLGALDPGAIARVHEEAWPDPRDAGEVHDALLGLVVLRSADVPDWSPWLEELISAGRASALHPAHPEALEGRAQEPEADERLYFAAENLNLVRLLYPAAEIDPPVELPPGVAVEVGEREDARLKLIRGQMEVLGPITSADLAERVRLGETDVDYGMRQAEAGGYVLRGRFTQGALTDEFCDRRLLARIHRYTLDSLRREIDPVSAQDFMRFLLRWHHLTPDTRLEGKMGVRQAILRLQGFEAAASAWERELLAARVRDYRIAWLDELCLAGEVVWARLTPRKATLSVKGPAPSRTTPLTLALRTDFELLLAGVRASNGAAAAPSVGAAGEVYELLGKRGALFFDEVVNRTRRLKSDVERALRELVAWGLVTADGFQGLRQLIGGIGQTRRPRLRSALYGPGGVFAGPGPAGRWSLVHAPEPLPQDELAEGVAQALLQRYGVVFRDLIQRESFTVPWRDILRALRRLEARGVIRGGRFVSSFVGEQYALQEAVEALRRVRRLERSGERVWVSATDPLNLAGIVVPGERRPAQPGKGTLFIDGLPTGPAEPIEASPTAGTKQTVRAGAT
jgi:ATP-dependent helicase Lhr and Lhr-like helicase